MGGVYQKKEGAMRPLNYFKVVQLTNPALRYRLHLTGHAPESQSVMSRSSNLIPSTDTNGFTMADISLAYAVMLAQGIGLEEQVTPGMALRRAWA